MSLAGIGDVQGVLKRDVAGALSRTTGAMTACYVADLRLSTSPKSGRGSLHVETDGGGSIVRATARLPFAGAAARCIERAVLGTRIAGVDTGEASADAALAFEVR